MPLSKRSVRREEGVPRAEAERDGALAVPRPAEREGRTHVGLGGQRAKGDLAGGALAALRRSPTAALRSSRDACGHSQQSRSNCGSVWFRFHSAVSLGIHLSVPSPRRRARRHARRSLLRWPTRKRVRALCQATSPLRTRNRDARIGATCTHARRSSAPIVRSPRRPAPRLLFHGTLSVRIGAHAGHARTTTALAAVLRRAVSIRRTRHRHADRRCPHRRQSCPQTCRRACHPAAKTGARLLLPAGIASAKRILGRRRRRVPSAPNAALARVPQTRSHQRRYAGHGRPSPHLRHCLGHRHPHRSHQS